MKLWISVMTAVSLGLTCTALADNYDALAAQGYRWVTVDGPFACTSEQDVQRITTEHTDATELQVVENIRCYYLIPGTIVQVIKEDPARRMSEIRLEASLHLYGLTLHFSASIRLRTPMVLLKRRKTLV